MINSAWKRLLLLVLPLLLSGCVHYDVGINFYGLHRGEIVQHIELGQQLTNFSQADVEDWLGSLQARSRQLGGQTQRLSPQAVELTIPFANAQELETKFNQFFNPKNTTVTQAPSQLVQLDSQLTTDQNNFILFQRTHFKLNIDLTALGTIKGENSLLVGASSLLDLEFRCQTPWGMKMISPEAGENQSLVKQTGTETIWYLQPGENNQIEVVFWLPEPLGWGAIAIIIIVYMGLLLKSRSSPSASSNLPQT
ncbi:hypothetical protein PCC7418_2099 [Halothece sp. PCC 7418]|uniref:DUF3153 domain-containing protein n=1 Tax=Halothece sp. (strain PCC 7418) TaxID=65093 RepID=UPI0002A088CD|nr:DUF3153 domain-containing protein [Halothece sp. PCC 7418]AFZ44261.1 hypothetical protein PCC7418_2099 [Halothece sp. PCC 7418]